MEAIKHRQTVFSLYRSILRLHRSLPQEMRYLGDNYLKDEFARHIRAKPEFVPGFLEEWRNYHSSLKEQLGQNSQAIGKGLLHSDLDSLTSEQVGQLYALKTELEDPTTEEEFMKEALLNPSEFK